MSAGARGLAGALGAVALLSLPGYGADYAPPAPPAAAETLSPVVTLTTSHDTAAPRDNDVERGQALYSSYCEACHQADGEGIAATFPPLKGSALVNRADASKHIDVVLDGLQAARVAGVTYANPMPAFAATLSDAEVAAIVDYERSAWGNQGVLITAAQVASERARLR